MISVQKTLPMLGESIGITTNLPEGSTMEEIYNEINKIGSALDKRMAEAQQKMLEMEKKEAAIKQVAKDISKGKLH